MSERPDSNGRPLAPHARMLANCTTPRLRKREAKLIQSQHLRKQKILPDRLTKNQLPVNRLNITRQEVILSGKLAILNIISTNGIILALSNQIHKIEDK